MKNKKYFISNNLNKNKIKFTKQTGGSVNISGPAQIGYFVSTKFNKKIIIISDIHSNFDGSCDNLDTPSITKYIESINTDYPIDIFIETDIPHHHFLSNPSDKYLKILKTKIPYGKDFITELVDFSYQNYKINPNKRFHFVDVRYDIIGQDSFRTVEKVIDMIKNNIIQIEDNNLSYVIHELITDYVTSLFQIIEWISSNLKNPNFDDIQFIVPYYFYKEFELLYKSDPEVFKCMVEILYKYIDDFIFNYSRSICDNDSDININVVDQAYKLGIRAGASITDFYTVARIMKSDKFNNCIIYGGLGHYSILKSFLESIEFDCVEEISSSEPEFRCIKNVTDFDTFFQSNY